MSPAYPPLWQQAAHEREQQLVARVADLERALRRERERAEQEHRRAEAAEAQARVAWRTAWR